MRWPSRARCRCRLLRVTVCAALTWQAGMLLLLLHPLLLHPLLLRLTLRLTLRLRLLLHPLQHPLLLLKSQLLRG